jgi:glucose/arabinose dehydrogenase
LQRINDMFEIGNHAARAPVSAMRLIAIAVLFAAACSNQPPTESPAHSGSNSIGLPATATAAPSSGASSAGATASATAGSSATAASTQTVAPTLPALHIALTQVVAGLDNPVAISSAGDGRIFVVEQTGKIAIVQGGSIVATFLDISSRISCCGERGLLGLAFHPMYATNGRFFVRYTDPAGDVRVSEFRVGSDPNAADPKSEKILLTIPHPNFANHNGGVIAFGPDGYLYVGTGDGGSGGDPNNHGQSLSTLLGKLLRIGVDNVPAGAAYAIPSGNPFAGQAGLDPEIFAYGLRNPYSFSFDRQTGDLWIGDVGQDQWEEVDRATAASGGGRAANFGWSLMEATHCYKPGSGCDTSGKVLPLAEYSHGSNDSTGCAIIGGFVYRGAANAALAGRYFFGDNCSGTVWDVTAAGPASQSPQLLLSSGLHITGWGQGADGELYVVASDGGLYHLT